MTDTPRLDEYALLLAHAVRLEHDALLNYRAMAGAMHRLANTDAAAFFDKMAHYAGLHLGEVMRRGGFEEPPALPRAAYRWPEGTSPELASWNGVDVFTDELGAMLAALDAEQRAAAYYRMMAVVSREPRTRAAAETFAQEETDHIEALQARIAAAARE
jgi:rubrerythrin